MHNLRMSPRKVRLVANLISGLSVASAKAQLTFLIKKPASLILKLVRSAAANAKQNFQIEEKDLIVEKILVEAGPTLKRWLPRAMGRASAIHKRTCSIKLWLKASKEAKPVKDQAKKEKPPAEQEVKLDRPEALVEKLETLVNEKAKKGKEGIPARPYGASSQSKEKNFSRQTFGNIKKMFRRKSI